MYNTINCEDTIMGRPEWIPTPERIKQVEEYAALDLTKEQIAACMGISYQTLNEKSKDYIQFSEAIEKGQARGIAMVAGELTKNINLGNVTAQIYFLKCRAGWHEKEQITPDDAKALMQQVIDKL